MKRLAMAALTTLLLCPHAFASPWIKSVALAQKQAKQSQQLIFVDLFADWCGWCHRMEQEVFPSEPFQKATDEMVLLRLNTEDGGEGTKLAQKYAVTSLPTFLVLTPDLYLAGSIRGYAPAREFVEHVKDVETKYRDFEKRVAGEASLGKDYQKRFDLAREFTLHWDTPRAQARFKSLIDDPKTPAEIRDRSYYELAIVHVLQSHMDDALKTLAAFSKIQSKGESYERSRILLAQIDLQQGNATAAKTELRSFRTRFPNSPLRANAEVMLAQLEQNGGR